MSDTAIVNGNKASKTGGGISLHYGSTLNMTGGKVENNTSSAYTGGGIILDNSTGSIRNALIKGNRTSNFGGGIHACNGSDVTVENTQITENTAFGGGGVSAQSNATVTINGGTIYKNSANRGGGLRIDLAAANLNDGVEISENGSVDGMYNDYNIYGAGIWINGTSGSSDSNEASISTLNLNNANVINNYSQIGGGMYIYDDKEMEDDVVDVNLYKGRITGNTATLEGAGICCKLNQITIKGGIQITGNMLKSETEEISNNVYLKNNTMLNIENPYSESESGDELTEALIGVTVEDGYSNVVSANDTDYRNCIIPDSEKDRVYYDESDKIVKIVGTYTVTFDMGEDIFCEETVDRNTTVSEPKETPYREGYYFGGWYNGATPYDFTQPVSSDLTLTARWLEAGTFGMSITPSKIYIVTDKATAYGAAYKDEKLTSVVTQNIVNYAVIDLSTIDLDMRNADTISLFVWDGNQAPLCGKISYDVSALF